MVNQVELHPLLAQAELREFDRRHSIVTEAWSPLAHGLLLADDMINRIAEQHERTPAQVVLRWHIQLGNVVIPKSVTPERIRANFDIFDFELTDQEMDRIAVLDDGTRTGPDPDEFDGD
jgi:diketogulonate reductase-like aldo/keto reductase